MNRAADTFSQSSDERYRIISELVSDFAYAIRRESDGRQILEWVTKACERITGFTLEELQARGSLLNLAHPEDQDIVRQHDRRLISGAASISDFRIIGNDGQVHWVRDHGQPIADRESNRVVYIYGAAREITDYKLAERELKYRCASPKLRTHWVDNL